MAFDAHVVYAVDGRIAFIRRTQAEAQADVAADAELSRGLVVGVPDWVLPGYYYKTADSSFRQDPELSALEQLKVAARACHNQLLTWSALLAAEAITHSAADVAIGHDILFHGHEGVYLVCTSDTWTNAQKILFCQQTAIGASDVTTPAEFFERVHLIDASLIVGPVVWVDSRLGRAA